MSTKTRVLYQNASRRTWHRGGQAYAHLESDAGLGLTLVMPEKIKSQPRWQRAQWLVDHMSTKAKLMIWREPRRVPNRRSAYIQLIKPLGITRKVLTAAEFVRRAQVERERERRELQLSVRRQRERLRRERRALRSLGIGVPRPPVPSPTREEQTRQRVRNMFREVTPNTPVTQPSVGDPLGQGNAAQAGWLRFSAPTQAGVTDWSNNNNVTVTNIPMNIPIGGTTTAGDIIDRLRQQDAAAFTRRMSNLFTTSEVGEDESEP